MSYPTEKENNKQTPTTALFPLRR